MNSMTNIYFSISKCSTINCFIVKDDLPFICIINRSSKQYFKMYFLAYWHY